MTADEDTYQSKLEDQYQEYKDIRNLALQFAQILISLVGLVGIGYLLQHATNFFGLSVHTYTLGLNEQIINANSPEALRFHNPRLKFHPSTFSPEILILGTALPILILVEYFIDTMRIFRLDIRKTPTKASIRDLSEAVQRNRHQLYFAKYAVRSFKYRIVAATIIGSITLYVYSSLKMSSLLDGVAGFGIQLIAAYSLLLLVMTGLSVLTIYKIGKVLLEYLRSESSSFGRHVVYEEYSGAFDMFSAPVLIASTVLMDIHLGPYLWDLTMAVLNAYSGLQ